MKFTSFTFVLASLATGALAHADFDCTNQNHIWVNVSPDATQVPRARIVLRQPDAEAQDFQCESASFEEGKALLTEYACLGTSTGHKLSFYTAQEGDKFQASLYSQELEIEADGFQCFAR